MLCHHICDCTGHLRYPSSHVCLLWLLAGQSHWEAGGSMKQPRYQLPTFRLLLRLPQSSVWHPTPHFLMPLRLLSWAPLALSQKLKQKMSLSSAALSGDISLLLLSSEKQLDNEMPGTLSHCWSTEQTPTLERKLWTQ